MTDAQVSESLADGSLMEAIPFPDLEDSMERYSNGRLTL